MASQAQNLIQQLQAQGKNYSAIGKLVGRDSSYISQIARGKRTGESLIPTLNKIVTGETENVKAPRKTKKSGVQANVRKGAIRDTKRRIINETSSTPNGPKLRNDLRTIEKNNGLVGVVVSYRKYQAYDDTTPSQRDVAIWSNGVSAKWINSKLSSGYTMTSLVQEQIENAYNPHVADGITNIQVNVVYTHDKKK
jgi:hypothetical protein